MGDDISRRIQALRRSLRITQKEFGRLLGVSASYVSKLESGAESPSSVLRMLICARFSVREEWLEEGREPMLVPLSEKMGEIERIYGVSEVARYQLIASRVQPIQTLSDCPQTRQLHEFLQLLLEVWEGADINLRGWILVQLQAALGNLFEAQKKQSPHAAAGAPDGA